MAVQITVQVHREVEMTLRMSDAEAQWLKMLVAKPIHNSEPDILTNLRTLIYNSLAEKGVK